MHRDEKKRFSTRIKNLLKENNINIREFSEIILGAIDSDGPEAKTHKERTAFYEKIKKQLQRESDQTHKYYYILLEHLDCRQSSKNIISRETREAALPRRVIEHVKLVGEDIRKKITKHIESENSIDIDT